MADERWVAVFTVKASHSTEYEDTRPVAGWDDEGNEDPSVGGGIPLIADLEASVIKDLHPMIKDEQRRGRRPFLMPPSNTVGPSSVTRRRWAAG
ncbi:hypothetical protein ACIP46_35720 [Streptomyces lavendulae]|uniref:hypothetical protein n=1 Tax=Streptomyces lavendulae TaxID=1914 RepID=UPI003809A03D